VVGNVHRTKDGLQNHTRSLPSGTAAAHWRQLREYSLILHSASILSQEVQDITHIRKYPHVHNCPKALTHWDTGLCCMIMLLTTGFVLRKKMLTLSSSLVLLLWHCHLQVNWYQQLFCHPDDSRRCQFRDHLHRPLCCRTLWPSEVAHFRCVLDVCVLHDLRLCWTLLAQPRSSRSDTTCWKSDDCVCLSLHSWVCYGEFSQFPFIISEKSLLTLKPVIQTWGPIIWTICAEMYPSRYRSNAMALSTASNWVCLPISRFSLFQTRKACLWRERLRAVVIGPNSTWLRILTPMF
jgi:hypothetical protein